MKEVLRLFLDVECYKNYFLVMLMSDDGKTKCFESYDDIGLDVKGLLSILNHPKVEIVTFNGNTYDLPIISYALTGVTNSALKSATNAIITKNIKPWNFKRQYITKEINPNHIDLIEVAPGMVSLKIYGGRLHSDRLQDLPIDPEDEISQEQREVLKYYCRNDLRVTKLLYDKLSEPISLRRAMSIEYGVDLRSKSDAQIAEAVLKAEAYRLTGIEPTKQPISYSSFFYEPPGYIKFFTDTLKNALEVICSSEMIIKDTGHVEMPKAIDDMVITIGGSKYKIGIGGLHSQESEVSHYADETTLLRDRDVTSYYPNLMLNMGMEPKAFGGVFRQVYRKILDERVDAKRAGDKVKADSLKITLNGTFGKTSNKFSLLYNPEMMVRTTLTGQLSLLMLIEILESRGIPVVSANTDGIVIKCPADKESLMLKIVALWEKVTNLETEETQYLSLHSRDVNNYIAIKTDGKVKTKGVYAPSGLQKNPQNEVCSDAVVAYLKDGVPVEDTIISCKDIRKFLTLRTVQGGAVKDGVFLGKAIRWYYASGVSGAIHYKTNGNTVPRTEGAMPIMDLPEEFPKDIDYDWYISESKDILMSVGAVPRPVVEKLPRRNTKEWKRLVEDGSIVLDRKGEWKWA